MRAASKNASNVIESINRRKLRNNAQRVLVTLINTKNKDGWVARTALSVPSATARIRDLRKSGFGGFRIECASPEEINRKNRSKVTSRQTYYRIVPETVTVDALNRALKGVI